MNARTDAEEAARLRRELRQLLHAAGHDLAEPARTIKSFLGLIDQRHGASLASEAREFMGFAVDAAGRLEVMLQALLELGRIGAEPPSAEPIELGPLVVALAASLQPRLDEAAGRVEIGDLPVVAGDRKLWRRLFAILIENALLYRGTAAPHLRIASGHGRITIADNGIGIDPRFFARIFEPFQRLHTRGAIPGCGMGLTIARRIAEHHGSTLDVEPGENGGSVFVLTLPPAQPAP